MNQILCSSGALIGKPNNRDYRLLEPLSKMLECDGFEFMLYSSWYPILGQLTSDIRQMHLNIPAMHCEKHIGEKISLGGDENLTEAMRLFRLCCETASRISAGLMVLHLWDGMPSDQNFANNLAAYPELKAIADSCGILLTVENVVCNQQDPLTHLQELAFAYPDISYTYDTKMAAFHEQHERIYENEYRYLWTDRHIRHLHINDYAGGYMDWENLKTLHPGDGHIDFDRFFAFLKDTSYEGNYTVEATSFLPDGRICTSRLNETFRKLKNWLS